MLVIDETLVCHLTCLSCKSDRKDDNLQRHLIPYV